MHTANGVVKAAFGASPARGEEEAGAQGLRAPAGCPQKPMALKNTGFFGQLVSQLVGQLVSWLVGWLDKHADRNCIWGGVEFVVEIIGEIIVEIIVESSPIQYSRR